jgi:hypothetical protein
LSQVHNLLHRVFWSGIDGKLSRSLTAIL